MEYLCMLSTRHVYDIERTLKKQILWSEPNGRSELLRNCQVCIRVFSKALKICFSQQEYFVTLFPSNFQVGQAFCCSSETNRSFNTNENLLLAM